MSSAKQTGKQSIALEKFNQFCSSYFRVFKIIPFVSPAPPLLSLFKLVEMIEILVSSCPIESFKLNFYSSEKSRQVLQLLQIPFHILSVPYISCIFLVSRLQKKYPECLRKNKNALRAGKQKLDFELIGSSHEIQ